MGKIKKTNGGTPVTVTVNGIPVTVSVGVPPKKPRKRAAKPKTAADGTAKPKPAAKVRTKKVKAQPEPTTPKTQ